VLERTIAERGRFPAVDVRRSVSRSLPGCASEAENALLMQARRLIGTYEDAEPMIRTGLYQSGADAAVDAAMAVHDGLEAFVASSARDAGESFRRLAAALAPASAAG
jgi:flagellum-specific ATP synthase